MSECLPSPKWEEFNLMLRQLQGLCPVPCIMHVAPDIDFNHFFVIYKFIQVDRELRYRLSSDQLNRKRDLEGLRRLIAETVEKMMDTRYKKLVMEPEGYDE